MTRLRTRLMAALAVTGLGVTTLAATGGTAQALSNPANPVLAFNHIISSHPFPGGPSNASDIEGLADVPGDNSMWVADDNADSVWEINATSGAYKLRLRGGDTSNPKNLDFSTATEVGTGLTCGQKLDVAVVGDTAANECLARSDDFESVVYDPTDDVLYVTSGIAPSQTLPGTGVHPAVWQLTRVGGHFKPTSWQELPAGEDPTAAGWRPGTGLYFGKGTKLKTYDFASNTLGSSFSIGVSDIVGVTFTDASTAFVTTARVDTSAGRTTATSDSTLHRFNISGSNWSADPKWTFPLKSIGGTAPGVDDDGMIDARDLQIVGDSFYVTDGYDGRASGDHPIYVYDLVNATPSFLALPTAGNRPLTVNFGDTSTGNPVSWDWNFGDGSAHGTTKLVSHTYNTAGKYTVTLTVGWSGGSTAQTTQDITVTKPTGAPGGYIVDGFGGLQRVTVGNGPTPPAPNLKTAPYWQGWDIARGVALLPNKTGGYVLDGFGGIHPFGLGTNAGPSGAVKGGGYWVGWDIARGIALMPNGKSGYMIDGFGGIHPFAIGNAALPPATVGNPFWQGQDLARGIMLTTDGKGGYVVDKTGKLYRFKVGTGGTKPAAPNTVGIVSAVQMQGGSFVSDNTGGLTVDGFGGTHGFGVGSFGPPPAVTVGPYWPGWDIARDLALFSS